MVVMKLQSDAINNIKIIGSTLPGHLKRFKEGTISAK